MRRALRTPDDLAEHLGWLRYAIHDRHVDVRLILAGLLEAIEALVDVAPGPPRTPGQ